MTTRTTAAIERHLELRAAPDRVWRALTDPKEIARWFSQHASIRWPTQPAQRSHQWLILESLDSESS